VQVGLGDRFHFTTFRGITAWLPSSCASARAPRQPRHDGADRYVQGPADLLVGELFHGDEENDLALLGRQPAQYPVHVLQLEVLTLGSANGHRGHFVHRLLDFVPRRLA